MARTTPRDAAVVATLGVPAPAGRWSRVSLLGRAVALIAFIAVIVALGLTLAPANALELQYAVSLTLFAVATNLILGFGGLVSFGQGIFYGVGAYTVALGWMHHSLNFTEAMILAPFFGAAAAVPLGMLALRTRRLYFSLLTLTMSQLAYVIAENQTNFTGGTNGVFGAMVPTWLLNLHTSFLFTAAIVTVSIAVLWKIVHSPFGLVLRAIRDNRERVEALGVNVYAHELAAFVISAFFCSLAGSLFVVYSQSSYPEILNWTASGVPVFMAVIGGMYSFFGPVVGAFVYEFANHYLIEYTQDWQLVIGVVLLAIVLLRPDGLAGSLGSLRAWLRRRRQRAGDVPATAAATTDDAGGRP